MDAKRTAKRTANRIDDIQQRHPAAGFPIAVVKKFGEDQAGNLAALIAYWAFFSLFPLLLVAVTLLGFAHVRGAVVADTLGQFPIVGASVTGGKVHLGGSIAGLVIGVLTALWSGLAVVKTAQSAFNSVWEVPMTDRPGLLDSTMRSLKALVVLGIGVLATIGLSAIATGGKSIHVGWPIWARILVAIAAVALDVVIFAVSYRWLTHRDLSFRDVLPGAALAGVIWFFLQMFGTALITHQASGQKGAYGTFAIVLGLLWWFYVQAQVTLLGAEINVVRAERLWPRGLVDAPDTAADHRAYTAYVEERTYHPNQEADTRFHDEVSPSEREAEAGSTGGPGSDAGATSTSGSRGGWRRDDAGGSR